MPNSCFLFRDSSPVYCRPGYMSFWPRVSSHPGATSCLWWGESEQINPGSLEVSVAARERWRLTQTLSLALSASYNCSAHSVDLLSPRFMSDHDNDLSNSRRYFAISQHHPALLSRWAASAWLLFLFPMLLGFRNDPCRTAKELLLSSYSSEVETPTQTTESHRQSLSLGELTLVGATSSSFHMKVALWNRETTCLQELDTATHKQII